MHTSISLEGYFQQFRRSIAGINHCITSPEGQRLPLVYADWIASGRSYLPIEERILTDVLPYVANTHTETNSSGGAMTHAYAEAQARIKSHVNAGPDDVLITAGSGMTRVINKFQRMLGLKEDYQQKQGECPTTRPVVFVTHMEHHSNHTSWLETTASVEIIRPTASGEVDLDHLRQLLNQYTNCPLKIASVTACSNVTGIETPYHDIARIMHAAGGRCFVDFACSAPYVDIDMHPRTPGAHLDAIFFSPHKFLGGPGSAGVLAFNRDLYRLSCPDQPGGGTVSWTDPWGRHRYIDAIEVREDGGTPAFLQTIRTALAVRLKEEMGTDKIQAREHELLQKLWTHFEAIPNLHILAPDQPKRLGVISFYIDGLHHALGVRLLNDKFGIQVRGGCSCAGTYGHYLLNIDRSHSEAIRSQVDAGDHAQKPGWIRVSLHPTMTDSEVDFIGQSVTQLALQFPTWMSEYHMDPNDGSVHSVLGPLDAGLKQQMEEVLDGPFHGSNDADWKGAVPAGSGRAR